MHTFAIFCLAQAYPVPSFRWMKHWPVFFLLFYSKFPFKYNLLYAKKKNKKKPTTHTSHMQLRSILFTHSYRTTITFPFSQLGIFAVIFQHTVIASFWKYQNKNKLSLRMLNAMQSYSTTTTTNQNRRSQQNPTIRKVENIARIRREWNNIHLKYSPCAWLHWVLLCSAFMVFARSRLMPKNHVRCKFGSETLNRERERDYGSTERRYCSLYCAVVCLRFVFVQYNQT